MTGINHTLHKLQKCATIAARQMWWHVTETSSRGVPYRLRPDVPPHGEQLAKRFFAFRGRCFVVANAQAVIARLNARCCDHTPLADARSAEVGDSLPTATTKHRFFCRRVTRVTQLGLHGLTRQTTPTRDTPRAARPNLAQVSVTLLVTQVETRPADKVNGPSRALGFFAAFLGPLAPIALNSGAGRSGHPSPIHPSCCYSCAEFAA